MTTILIPTITPDKVLSFEINPGIIPQLRETRTEKCPLLRCFEGSVTLVSQERSQAIRASRLDLLILAVCLEFGIQREGLRATAKVLDWLDEPESDDIAFLRNCQRWSQEIRLPCQRDEGV